MGILEKSIEIYLTSRVKALGGKAFKITSPGNNGFPDRLVCLPGSRMILTELKRPGMQPRPLQLAQIQFLRSLGIEVLVLDSKTAVDTFIEIMREDILNERADK